MSARGYKLPDSRIPAGDAGGVELAHRTVDVARGDDREYLAARAQSGYMYAKSWMSYRQTGEVRYAIQRSARIAGYANLFAEHVNANDTSDKRADSGVVAEIMRNVTSKFGGTRGLIERFYSLQKICGDSYLIVVRESGNVDGLWFMSPSELQYDQSATTNPAVPIRWVTAKSGTTGGRQSVFSRTVESRDFRGRVWHPDEEYVDNATSPMLSLNDKCDMLHRLTMSIMGRLQQRFTVAGLLLIPSEINDASISGDLPGNLDYGTNDKVLRYLIHIMTTGLKNVDQAVGQLPIIMKGPAAALESVRHVVADTMVAETDLRLRAELIDRIEDGLDQSRSQLQGSDQNRFASWSSNDAELRVAVKPELEQMCHALTRLYLWPALRERGWTETRIQGWRVWYDVDRANAKSNSTADVRDAFDRGEISGKTLRSSIGMPETTAMTDEERVRWVGVKMSNPVLALYGLDGIEVDWEEASKWNRRPGRNADDSGESEPQTSPGGDPGGPGDEDNETPADG